LFSGSEPMQEGGAFLALLLDGRTQQRDFGILPKPSVVSTVPTTPLSSTRSVPVGATRLACATAAHSVHRAERHRQAGARCGMALRSAATAEHLRRAVLLGQLAGGALPSFAAAWRALPRTSPFREYVARSSSPAMAHQRQASARNQAHVSLSTTNVW
jgi:hypothetical protein